MESDDVLQASLRGGLFHEQEPKNIVRNVYKIKLWISALGLSEIQVQAYQTFWSPMSAIFPKS